LRFTLFGNFPTKQAIFCPRLSDCDGCLSVKSTLLHEKLSFSEHRQNRQFIGFISRHPRRRLFREGARDNPVNENCSCGDNVCELELKKEEHGYDSAKERKARNAHNPGVEGPNPNRERGILGNVAL
jgi:hypothetical protein